MVVWWERRGCRQLVCVAAIVLALAATGLEPSGAQTPPGLTVSPTSGAPGDAITITGTCPSIGPTAIVGMQSTTTTQVKPLGQVETDVNGSFTLATTVPVWMNLRNQQWLDAIIPGTYDIIVAQAPECEATFTVTVAPTLTVTVTPSSGPPGTVVELDTGCRTVLGPQIQASDANGPIPELTWPTVSVPSAPPVLPRLTIPERPPGTIITFTGTCNAATLAPSTFTIPGPATTLPPTTAPPSVSPADAVRATPSFTG